jgi:hypothetical protein
MTKRRFPPGQMLNFEQGGRLELGEAAEAGAVAEIVDNDCCHSGSLEGAASDDWG